VQIRGRGDRSSRPRTGRHARSAQSRRRTVRSGSRRGRCRTHSGEQSPHAGDHPETEASGMRMNRPPHLTGRPTRPHRLPGSPAWIPAYDTGRRSQHVVIRRGAHGRERRSFNGARDAPAPSPQTRYRPRHGPSLEPCWTREGTGDDGSQKPFARPEPLARSPPPTATLTETARSATLTRTQFATRARSPASGW